LLAPLEALSLNMVSMLQNDDDYDNDVFENQDDGQVNVNMPKVDLNKYVTKQDFCPKAVLRPSYQFIKKKENNLSISVSLQKILREDNKLRNQSS
jgi:hypothetical protein